MHLLACICTHMHVIACICIRICMHLHGCNCRHRSSNRAVGERITARGRFVVPGRASAELPTCVRPRPSDRSHTAPRMPLGAASPMQIFSPNLGPKINQNLMFVKFPILELYNWIPFGPLFTLAKFHADPRRSKVIFEGFSATVRGRQIHQGTQVNNF